jgi:serine/threonine protein kinase
MPGGSLDKVIEKREEYTKLTATEKVKMIVGIAAGMAYVHASNIWHRDLKPANILLDNRKEIRIADFGTARIHSEDLTVTVDALGTPLYICPDDLPSKLMDVWSYGMIVWELFKGVPLKVEFKGKYGNVFDLQPKLKAGLRPRVDGLTKPVKDVLDQCWSVDKKTDGSLTRSEFSTLLKFYADCNYQLVENVNVSEVKEYLSKIREYEAEHPPRKIGNEEDE